MVHSLLTKFFVQVSNQCIKSINKYQVIQTRLCIIFSGEMCMHTVNRLLIKKYINCIFVQYEKIPLFPEDKENSMVYMYNVG